MMQILHFAKCITMLHLTDDFGDQIQVIPGEHCRSHLERQVIINYDSWTALACMYTGSELLAIEAPT